LKPPHGHGHSQLQECNNQGIESHHMPENLNVRAAFVHVVGDLMFSIGVLIAAFVIKFKVSDFQGNSTLWY
jgi:Co/Zn/Cd efflux system component